jgi:hypothetical protein
MKKIIFALITVFALTVSFTQVMADDIAVDTLPPEVKQVLDEYISILNSPNLDECAEKFYSIAGGPLLNSDGRELYSDIKRFSLKKDFNAVKRYAQPLIITRVNLRENQEVQFGKNFITGKIYKIWIKKKDKSAGMPAPISIMLADQNDIIKSPKVIGIGSL